MAKIGTLLYENFDVSIFKLPPFESYLVKTIIIIIMYGAVKSRRQ